MIFSRKWASDSHSGTCLHHSLSDCAKWLFSHFHTEMRRSREESEKFYVTLQFKERLVSNSQSTAQSQRFTPLFGDPSGGGSGGEGRIFQVK